MPTIDLATVLEWLWKFIKFAAIVTAAAVILTFVVTFIGYMSQSVAAMAAMMTVNNEGSFDSFAHLPFMSGWGLWSPGLFVANLAGWWTTFWIARAVYARFMEWIKNA